MDIYIGKHPELREKISHRFVKSILNDPVIGYALNDDDLYAITNRELTDSEKSSALSALQGLEVASDILQSKSDKKNRKRQLLDYLATGTGLTRKQVLKCLMEVVQDGNDD